MAIIRIYKFVLDGDVEKVYRYTIPNLESLNVQYNTPISPMPLPEEDADENILVKIEGNSASIDIDWTLAHNDYTIDSHNHTCNFEEWTSEFGSKQSPAQILVVKTGDGRGKFDPIAAPPTRADVEPLTFRDMDEDTRQPSKQISMFRKYFESKSLNNDYLITIEDEVGGYGIATEPTRWYGSISQMSFSISGSSPIVWRARINFFVGNVITVFDSDSPESPQSLSGNTYTGDGTLNSGVANNLSPWLERHVMKVRFKDPTSFGATDANEVEIMYRKEGKLNWTSVRYDIETDTGASQSVNALTKINNVLDSDHDYYVVYLPSSKENLAGADNYNLTSGGLFNTTAYQDSTTPPANSGTAIPAELSLSDDKYYTVKVHFRNTSGDGGFSQDTAQTKKNPT